MPSLQDWLCRTQTRVLISTSLLPRHIDHCCPEILHKFTYSLNRDTLIVAVDAARVLVSLGNPNAVSLHALGAKLRGIGRPGLHHRQRGGAWEDLLLRAFQRMEHVGIQ